MADQLLAAPEPGRRWPSRLPLLLAVAPSIRAIVATDAVPPGEPRRRQCPTCATPVGLTGTLGVLLPTGRCGSCGSRVGARPLLVELAVVLAVLALLLSGQPMPTTLAFAWWSACAVALTFIDIAVHRLPDRLTWPAAAGTWALLGLAALIDQDPTNWVRAMQAGAGLAVVFAASTLLLGRRGFGLGDAKLALSSTAILGWLGWTSVAAGLLVAFVASAVCALVLMMVGRVRWSGHLPFGPFLVLGTFVVIAIS